MKVSSNRGSLIFAVAKLLHKPHASPKISQLHCQVIFQAYHVILFKDSFFVIFSSQKFFVT